MEQLGENYLLLCASGIRKNYEGKKGDNMVWLGSLTQEKMAKYYNLCDIYLQPSRSEGFGLTVAEAMACGKPVVCTDCCSLPELVIDGKGGFLCEIDNQKDFAEKIIMIAVAGLMISSALAIEEVGIDGQIYNISDNESFIKGYNRDKKKKREKEEKAGHVA